MSAAALDEAAERRDIHVIEQATAALAHRVDHGARKAALRHQRNKRRVEPVIGEHHADELHPPRQRGECPNAVLAPWFRKQRDLDVIDAGIGQGAGGTHDPGRLHGELARDRAHWPTAVERGERRRHGVERHRPERAAPGILKVDDVGAVPVGNLGLVRPGHACKQQGHRNIQVDVNDRTQGHTRKASPIDT